MGQQTRVKVQKGIFVPDRILTLSGFPWGAKLLLAYISAYGMNGCWRSNDAFAKVFGVSDRTVSDWLEKLKAGRQLLWRHPKGRYRTLWDRNHPDVRAASSLPYRDQLIPKNRLGSATESNDQVHKNLRSYSAKTCEVTPQEQRDQVRKNMRHNRKNHTVKKQRMTAQEFEHRRQRLIADLSAIEQQNQQGTDSIRKD